MKIGISIYPSRERYIRFGDRKFEIIKQCGFDAVDYNLADTETALYTCPPCALEKGLAKERARADAAGIEISQVHGPWQYPPQDSTPEQRQERMQKMIRSLEITHLLDCKYWVVHPLMPCGTHDLQTGHAQQTWEVNLAFLSALLPHAKDLGVTVCLENMPMRDFSIATPRQIASLVDAINDDHLQVCLDTGHIACFPDLSFREAIETLGTRIKVLHVHDNLGDKDAHLWPTHGVIAWQELIRALRDIGFQGVFSLECQPTAEADDASFTEQATELHRIAQGILCLA